MLILSSFLKSLLEKYGQHTVYSDDGTWYPEACNVLGLKHIVFSFRKEFDGKGNNAVFQRQNRMLG